MKEKANLIFFYKDQEGSKYYYFLSRRSKDAKMFPDMYSFWGGGIEFGEKPHQAMLRELKEELDYDVKSDNFLGTFLTPQVLKHIYFVNEKKDIVDKLPILESQYGKWFTFSELKKCKKIIKEDLYIIETLETYLDNE